MPGRCQLLWLDEQFRKEARMGSEKEDTTLPQRSVQSSLTICSVILSSSLHNAEVQVAEYDIWRHLPAPIMTKSTRSMM
jgi:hypothetical protein